MELSEKCGRYFYNIYNELNNAVIFDKRFNAKQKEDAYNKTNKKYEDLSKKEKETINLIGLHLAQKGIKMFDTMQTMMMGE